MKLCDHAAMRLKLLLSVLSLLAFVSCAGKEVADKIPELYWPLPPERPRIKFVDIIAGSGDIEARFRKIRQFFFGEDLDANFQKPFGIAVRKGRLYVSDIGMVHYLDFGRGVYKRIGESDLRVPTGIALSEDRIFVADAAKKKIFVYDLNGQFIAFFGGKELDTPAGLALDEQRGRLIVSDSHKNKIMVYGLDGALLSSFGETGHAPGALYIPYGVTVDKDGRIYVVDSGNFRVQIFDEKGSFLKVVGEIGTSPGNFARPKGVALDSDGHIYVLDAAFGNFQIFDMDGNVLLAVGRTGTDPAEFVLPSSISIDEKDQIYIVDQVNKRVQIFQYLREGT